MRRRDHDPFCDGIPKDIEDRAREWIWAHYDEQDPSEGLLLDIAYGIYEDDVRKAADDRATDEAIWQKMGGLICAS